MAHQEQMQLHNDKVCRIYNNAETMDEALKNQVINTVKDMYPKE